MCRQSLTLPLLWVLLLSNRTRLVQFNPRMQITRATDYAVRVMVHLATLPAGVRVPVAELARAGGAPESFVSKVLQQLVRCGMVTSLRGMGGGFQLAVRPDQVTLLELVEAVEGPLQINLCLPGKQTCHRKSWCGVHPIWIEAQAALKKTLASTTIAHLASASVQNLSQISEHSRGRPNEIEPTSSERRQRPPG